MITATLKAAALAALVTVGAATGAAAQAMQADPHHPDTATAQPAPPLRSGEDGPMPAGMMRARMMCQEMMDRGMMDRDMMDRDMMGGMMQPGAMGGMPMMGMRRHMMKIMFAIADTDNDGALSFEEITTVHKRIFDKVDANRDGKVTPDEIQAFMQN